MRGAACFAVSTACRCAGSSLRWPCVAAAGPLAQEVVHAPVGQFLTLTSPITDEVIGRVRRTALALSEEAQRAGRPGVLVLEITPGTAPVPSRVRVGGLSRLTIRGRAAHGGLGAGVRDGQQRRDRVDVPGTCSVRSGLTRRHRPRRSSRTGAAGHRARTGRPRDEPTRDAGARRRDGRPTIATVAIDRRGGGASGATAGDVGGCGEFRGAGVAIRSRA